MAGGLYRRGTIWWGRKQVAGRELRRSLRTTDRSVGQSRYRKWVAELEGLRFGETPSHSFQEAVQRFAAVHMPIIRPSSAKRYAVSLKALARTILPGQPVGAIASALLSDFEAARRVDGASAPTIRRDLVCLSALLSYCIEWEWIEANPVPGYLRRRRRHGLKESPGRTRYLSEAEEIALLAHANEPCRTAILVSIDTGLRDQELFGLRHEQIDTARSIIRLGIETKGGRSRAVPLAQRSAQAIARLPRHLFSPFVFCRADGERLGRTIKGFKAACRRAELVDVRWHDLRRTAGCRWLQRDGRRMEEVSAMLGHADLRTTQKSYAFLDLEETAERAAHHMRGI